jgi:hypothetical protein
VDPDACYSQRAPTKFTTEEWKRVSRRWQKSFETTLESASSFAPTIHATIQRKVARERGLTERGQSRE